MSETPARPEVCIERNDHVARVTIDRPESLNGLTPAVCAELARAFEGLREAPDVRVVVFTGAGQAFSAGLDLKAAMKTIMGSGAAGADPLAERERALREDFHGLVRALHALEVPVIARIPGPAVGFGFDLALGCDLRYGVAQTKYGPVFTRIGLVPDGGGSWILPKLVGPGRAMEMVLTGRTFDGHEAARDGVLNAVFDTVEALDEAVDALVAHLVSLPPLALRAAKRLLRASLQGGGLEDALAREAEAQLAQLASSDTAAAIASFFTKKTPTYRGR